MFTNNKKSLEPPSLAKIPGRLVLILSVLLVLYISPLPEVRAQEAYPHNTVKQKEIVAGIFEEDFLPDTLASGNSEPNTIRIKHPLPRRIIKETLTGAGIGAFFGLATYSDCPPESWCMMNGDSRADNALLFGSIGAVAGLGIGTLSGLIKTARMYIGRNESVRVSASAGFQQKAIAAGVTFSIKNR